MRGRLLFLAGLATGYVLGSRAGRRAYDRLATKAREVWGDPNLQKVVAQTEQAAKEAASLAQAKVSGLIDQATTAVKAEREKGATVVEDTAQAASAAAKDAADSAANIVEDATKNATEAAEEVSGKSDTD